MPRRSLFVIALIALLHAGLYIAYQRGDWNSTTAWTDQRGYQRLGSSLATSGEFTRYTDSDVFVPEVIRTPGYPAFVAVVYLVFGVGNDMAVAIAQAFVFAAICCLVFALARRAAGDRAGLAAGLLAALYAPLPYFGSLVLTELWTAFVAVATMVVCFIAVRSGSARDFFLAGVLFSATALVRPAFFLMPYFFAIGVPILVRQQRTLPALKNWAILSVGAMLTIAPWFAYNYATVGQFTMSPAGGVGRGLWEGSWQGYWPGRTQAELIDLATTTEDRDQLTTRVRDVAQRMQMPAEPMLQYVNEWRDIRLIWDSPTDPMERARARVVADGEYQRHAMANIRRDPAGHVKRRLTRGLFVLWAAEVPIRYSDINTMPVWFIRLLWLLQVALLGAAALGVIWLARHDRWQEAVLLTMPILYVTGVHLPLLCEARQSLPVKPVVLALAGTALATFRRTEAS
jgi:4-amino-4-deoxy-L-arabinose transferase-like glycosyltransferase